MNPLDHIKTYSILDSGASSIFLTPDFMHMLDDIHEHVVRVGMANNQHIFTSHKAKLGVFEVLISPIRPLISEGYLCKFPIRIVKEGRYAMILDISRRFSNPVDAIIATSRIVDDSNLYRLADIKRLRSWRPSTPQLPASLVQPVACAAAVEVRAATKGSPTALPSIRYSSGSNSGSSQPPAVQDSSFLGSLAAQPPIRCTDSSQPPLADQDSAIQGSLADQPPTRSSKPSQFTDEAAAIKSSKTSRPPTCCPETPTSTTQDSTVKTSAVKRSASSIATSDDSISKRRRILTTLHNKHLLDSPIHTVHSQALITTPKSASSRSSRRGSSTRHQTATINNASPLQYMHLILGNASARTIIKMSKHNMVAGMRFSHQQLLASPRLPVCAACLVSNMKALSLPRSLQPLYVLQPFQFIGFDQQKLKTRSIDGYTWFTIFADKATRVCWAYGHHHQDEAQDLFFSLIQDHGPTANANSHHPRLLGCDHLQVNVAKEFIERIKMLPYKVCIHPSAPRKNGQNWVETIVQPIKGLGRHMMAHMSAPPQLFLHAIKYATQVYSVFPNKGKLISRHEEFYGIQPDISSFFVFYCRAWFHFTEAERKKHNTSDRAIPCRIIGTAKDPDVSSKNSYELILTDIKHPPGPKDIRIRHDVVLELTDIEHLLQHNPVKRFTLTNSYPKTNPYECLLHQQESEESKAKLLASSSSLTALADDQLQSAPPVAPSLPSASSTAKAATDRDHSNNRSASPTPMQEELPPPVPVVKESQSTSSAPLAPTAPPRVSVTPVIPASSSDRLIQVPAEARIRVSEVPLRVSKPNEASYWTDDDIDSDEDDETDSESINSEEQPPMQPTPVPPPASHPHQSRSVVWDPVPPSDSATAVTANYAAVSTEEPMSHTYFVPDPNTGAMIACNIPLPASIANDLWHPVNRAFREELLSAVAVQQADNRARAAAQEADKTNKNPMQNAASSSSHSSIYLKPDIDPAYHKLLDNIKTREDSRKRGGKTESFDKFLFNLAAHLDAKSAAAAPTPTAAPSESDHLVALLTYDLSVPVSMDAAVDPSRCQDHASWQAAKDLEDQRLDQRETFKEVVEGSPEDITSSRNNIVKSRYILKKSLNNDLTFKFKVRLVACGYSQTKYRDYYDTYAPTAKYKSFTILLHLAAANDWTIKHLDVENAFAESPLDELVYMWLPKTATSPPVKVRLLKSLYGLKQAAEYWYRNLSSTIVQLGYRPTMHDKCVFVKNDPVTTVTTYLIIYVDDVLIISADDSEIDSVVHQIRSAYTAITVEKAQRYLGVDIDRNVSQHSVRLSQCQSIDSIIDNSNVNIDKTRAIPLNPAYDYGVVGDGTIPPLWEEIGKLRYPADRTRLDINCATSILAQGAHKPSPHHVAGYKHLIKYLAQSRHRSLILGGDKEVELFAYCDASYLPQNDSKSRIGYAFFLNLESGSVSCRTKRSTTVDHSSTDAELRAIDETIRQAIWIRGFLAELGYPQRRPTVLYTDSKSAQTIAETCLISNNSSHIVMRINYIHEEITAGTVRLVWINALNQVADILTKPLALALHEPFADLLMEGHAGVAPAPMLFPTPSLKQKYKTARVAARKLHKKSHKK